MRNQVIMWGLFVVPWLSLFFMKRIAIKRYIPVAILSSLGVLVLNEFGLSYNWWAMKAISFPIQHFHPDYIGLFPVMTMWIFCFTYKKFWLYFAVEIIANLGFGFVFVRWFLTITGILSTNGMTGIMVFILTTGLGMALYAYQAWHDRTFELKENG